MEDDREATLCGKFGYELIGNDVIIPYIFRGNEKFCATRIFTWHFEQKMVVLNPNLIDFRYLKAYEMYREEIYLMNEINDWHNNSIYKYAFKLGDTIIKLDDVCDIFKYISECDKKSKLGADYQMIGGMIKFQFATAKPDAILPYITKNAKRYTPVHILNVQPKEVITINGIEVMYMRFLLDALKIEIPTQNFQMEFVQLDEDVIQQLADIDDVCDFDDNYWPNKESSAPKTVNNVKTLMTKNNNNLPYSFQKKSNSTAVQTHEDDKQTKSRKRQTSEMATKTNANPAFFEVHHLVDYKKQKGKEMVLVNWKGYTSEDDTWEPVSNLNAALHDDVEALKRRKLAKSSSSKK